jgi:histidinol dehydrogenase/sulfopropanediol 3-dehydrogenase
MGEVQAQLKTRRTEEIAKGFRGLGGEVVLVEDRATAAVAANDYAPEHLQVMTDNPRDLLEDLHNYGSLFLGHHAPVVFGDKAVGTNHTLPTLEVAKYSGGINVTTYLKVLTHQELTSGGADSIAPWAAKICEMEGTHAHQVSAEKRIISGKSRDLARELALESGGGVDLSDTDGGA